MKPLKLLPLLHLLNWLRPAPRRPRGARHALPHDDGTTLPPLHDEDEVPRGCGWFDSSHDLQLGLSVREHASPDTLVRELPLSSWIDLQLAGWRAGPAACMAFTQAT